MSCPHVSGIAKILKSHHPSWSPAAIMSEMMTTAGAIDTAGKAIGRDPNGMQTTPFNYGSGHINPIQSLNPGLVYEFNSYDVINFLCSTGASPAQLKKLTGQPTYCQNLTGKTCDFNCPSIGVSKVYGNVSVHRTVTYYGKGPTTYNAKVDYPDGVRLAVTPSILEFTSTGDKVSFRFDFMPSKASNGNFVFGALAWNNGINNVRSPISVNVVSL